MEPVEWQRGKRGNSPALTETDIHLTSFQESKVSEVTAHSFPHCTLPGPCSYYDFLNDFFQVLKDSYCIMLMSALSLLT
mgnify:CR=1 FL=1